MNRIITTIKNNFNGMEVNIVEVKKVGYSYQGIQIRPQGCNIAPVINPEMFREMSDAEIISYVRNILASTPDMNIPERFTFDEVKDKLVIQLIPVEGNTELLKGIPHRLVLNDKNAIIYRIVCSNTPEGICSALVKNEMFDRWGITADELYKTAIDSSLNILPPKFGTFGEMTGMPFMDDVVPFYILSNENKINGAACIFYPDLLEWIADKLGDDLYIIPSSIHEVIIIPASQFDGNSADIIDMIKFVNATEVAPEEKLSDSLLFYGRSCKKLLLIEE